MIEETKKKIAENLISSFEEAGNISLKLRKQGLKKEIKIDNTPVTNGDIEVNKLITAKIEKITPEIPIVSEESSTNKSNENLKTFWLIDPIDGTHDYINGRDEFTINAGLIINNRPEVGIVYAPGKKRLFYTFHEGKCFELSNNKEKKLDCSKLTKKGEVKAVSYSNKLKPVIEDWHKKFNVTEYIKMKSSFKFCVVATGEYDLYVAEPRACEWDIAAGHAILKNAGGIITDFENKEILYGKKDFKNSSLILKRSSLL
ncbi:MAG TPA: 3'(2'),5'-bisphosphate nucleotidase CysQ [Candidatus Pelagibacter bacterium]|jgi:3'(2'), 5'-bisphosphate nucleotidase|nr:3'(2'),5'-bisphosphate nucleotidase CysQ [Candidatus Pelagibacter bacterium]|tara:strand:+ start:124 stop:897 length:774 start_codon:yes stop_codon:yes gene_type:complete